MTSPILTSCEYAPAPIDCHVPADQHGGVKHSLEWLLYDTLPDQIYPAEVTQKLLPKRAATVHIDNNWWGWYGLIFHQNSTQWLRNLLGNAVFFQFQQQIWKQTIWQIWHIDGVDDIQNLKLQSVMTKPSVKKVGLGGLKTRNPRKKWPVPGLFWNLFWLDVPGRHKYKCINKIVVIILDRYGPGIDN